MGYGIAPKLIARWLLDAPLEAGHDNGERDRNVRVRTLAGHDRDGTLTPMPIA